MLNYYDTTQTHGIDHGEWGCGVRNVDESDDDGELGCGIGMGNEYEE